jgi:glucose-1-phosphate cytidylyltransferase
MEKIKVVILCGGRGTRLKEETEFKPKPLLTIGDKPIIWHIMKIYSHYGYKDFILCLGYKGDMIKRYFLDYQWMNNDFTINLGDRKSSLNHHTQIEEDWNITFANTGETTLTGGRIKKIEKYINENDFMVTYGDGVANVDINKLVEFHKKEGKIGTITGVHPSSKYGTVDIDQNNVINEFKEKPILKDIINGGFFVFKKEFFNYIKGDCMLEKEPFEQIVREKQLALFKHEDFWHCMDTYKDFEDLNKMESDGKTPWKVWKN